jgi:hypothetical protein
MCITRHKSFGHRPPRLFFLLALCPTPQRALQFVERDARLRNKLGCAGGRSLVIEVLVSRIEDTLALIDKWPPILREVSRRYGNNPEVMPESAVRTKPQAPGSLHLWLPGGLGERDRVFVTGGNPL